MIPLVILLLLIPLPVLALEGGNVTAIYAEATCTPTNYSPYYNCDEPLFIVIWDLRYAPWYNISNDVFYINENSTALGVVTYNIKHEPTAKNNFSSFNVLSVGNTYDLLDYGKYDEPGKNVSVFQHELQHVVCKCTWHPRQ